MARSKVENYDADQVVDESKVKKTPEEVQQRRLQLVSKEVIKTCEQLKKVSLYSHPRYKLTQAQIEKIREELDKAFSIVSKSLISTDRQVNIFDSQ